MRGQSAIEVVLAFALALILLGALVTSAGLSAKLADRNAFIAEQFNFTEEECLEWETEYFVEIIGEPVGTVAWCEFGIFGLCFKGSVYFNRTDEGLKEVYEITTDMIQERRVACMHYCRPNEQKCVEWEDESWDACIERKLTAIYACEEEHARYCESTCGGDVVCVADCYRPIPCPPINSLECYDAPRQICTRYETVRETCIDGDAVREARGLIG